MKPAFFIIGIVIDPVDTVLATALPEIVPIKLEAKTATKPDPPGNFPAIALDKLIINSLPPDFNKKEANKININIEVEEIEAAEPKSPSSVKYIRYKTLGKLKPRK